MKMSGLVQEKLKRLNAERRKRRNQGSHRNEGDVKGAEEKTKRETRWRT